MVGFTMEITLDPEQVYELKLPTNNIAVHVTDVLYVRDLETLGAETIPTCIDGRVKSKCCFKRVVD
jgi:hypothetical protein